MARKPVIVVVDIDDDISQVLGRNLIRGREEVEKAALAFGVERPEDADVNAILAGLQLYRRFREQGLDPEIIVVGGHPVDNLEAQRRIKESVRRVVEDIGEPVEFYIVSDGEDELMVAELLHDLGEIGGFRRVVVEQHLGIEGSYVLVLRYLRKALNDPRYSKYVVGIPGFGLVLIAVLSLSNLASLAFKLFLLLLGLAMVVRGFNLEGPLESQLSRLAASIRENPHFNAVGILLLILFLATGAYTAYTVYREAGVTPRSLGLIMKDVSPLIGAGLLSYLLITRVFYKMSYGNLGIVREVEAMIVTIFLTVAFYNLGVSLAELPEGAEAVPLTVFIRSGFIQYVIIGTGLAVLVEILRRGASGQASGQSSSSA